MKLIFLKLDCVCCKTPKKEEVSVSCKEAESKVIHHDLVSSLQLCLSAEVIWFLDPSVPVEQQQPTHLVCSQWQPRWRGLCQVCLWPERWTGMLSLAPSRAPPSSRGLQARVQRASHVDLNAPSSACAGVRRRCEQTSQEMEKGTVSTHFFLRIRNWL